MAALSAVIPWEHLDAAPLPDGGELKLSRRGQEYSIRLAGAELMNSRLFGSEEALATLVAARLGRRAAPAILIGGLGMGFTLRAALAAFQPETRVTVAELLPAVIRWARGPLAPIFGTSLDDPRTQVVEADVARLIGTRPDAWDAILLDVDNGPDAMTASSNDGLYGVAGLGRARAALRRGGVLAVWSAAPDDSFAARLRRVGFQVADHRVKADRGRRGTRHVIWLATRT